jgi:hypothetical protein
MDPTQAVDIYCERLGPGLLAEPANALSNLAFFAAAAVTQRSVSRLRNCPGPLRLLPTLIALIGIGSTAFHTLALRWTEWLDVACIAVFIHYFVACYLRYCAGLPWRFAWLGVPGFVLFGWVITRPFAPGSFNGSVDYFPALAGIVLMAGYAAVRGRGGAYYFAAAAVLLLSLWLRTEDQAWCGQFPLGTHWAWHCLNAITLSLVTWVLLRTSGTAQAAGQLQPVPADAGP